MQAKSIRDDVLMDAGLITSTKDGQWRDFFSERIMFPIHDRRGRVIAFGGRALSDDGPKYLNSSESAIYHKSRLLYGLNWAKSEIVRSDEAVVVEGYTDVIAFHLAGHPVAVATCGTALGEEHLDLLRRSITARAEAARERERPSGPISPPTDPFESLRGQTFMTCAKINQSFDNQHPHEKREEADYKQHIPAEFPRIDPSAV